MMRTLQTVESLVAELAEHETEVNIWRARAVLKKVVQLNHTSVYGSELLLPQVIKLMASGDLLVKKLCSLIISYQELTSEMALLAINTLLKDSRDPNPSIRALSLKTVATLPAEFLPEYAMNMVRLALKDDSAYVRRVAVMATQKIHTSCPGVWNDTDMIDNLYASLRDPDPVVVVNCLVALQHILAKDGGITVNKNIAHYLLNNLSIHSDWGLIIIIENLLKYKPKTEEETFDIMNVMDVYLKHNNCTLVTKTQEYFLHLIRDLPHLKFEVHSRAKKYMLQLLSSGNNETCYYLLLIIEGILQENAILYSSNPHPFFCKNSEPLYIKKKKIDILPKLVTSDNMESILEELILYSSDVLPVLSKNAIQAVGQIAQQDVKYHSLCVEQLITLLDLKVDYVMSNVLLVLQKLDFKPEYDMARLLESVSRCVDYVVDMDGRCALVWLLGEYGEHLPEAPYIIEQSAESMCDSGLSSPSPTMQLHLLTATVKLFFKRPAELQDTLGSLLETCIHSEDRDVYDRAIFYYSILQADPQKARYLILGSM